MIKKTVFACLMALIALLATPGAQAQTIDELMPLVAQEMNQRLNPSDPITKAEWDAKSSSLILFMNKSMVAESGIDEATISKPETKQIIVDTMMSNDGELAEVITAMEQLGVHFVIRIPVGNGFTDITIRSSDIK